MSYANFLMSFINGHTKMGATLMRFYADFTAPGGFAESEVIWAETIEDAKAQAEAHKLIRWKGWPLDKERILVSVNPEWDSIILPDGQSMLRRDYERRLAAE